MAVMSRKEVRDIFARGADDAGKGLNVFSGRHIDALHDSLPAAIVSFDTIEVQEDMSGGFRFAGTILMLIVVNGDHDLLDTYIDPVIVSTIVAWKSQVPTAGCRLAEITYLDDVDPGVVAGQLTWTVTFNG
jgi:hypothetical protein